MFGRDIMLTIGEEDDYDTPAEAPLRRGQPHASLWVFGGLIHIVDRYCGYDILEYTG